MPFLEKLANIFAYIKKISYLCSRFEKRAIMDQLVYTVEELRASVEEGTRQIENGQYLTDAQVKKMHHLLTADEFIAQMEPRIRSLFK